MAFRNLIQSQVNNAFNLIGDLAENIMFTNNSVSEYNFETGDTTEVTGSQVTIRGVVSKMSKDVNDNTMIVAELTLKTSDVSTIEIDNYDAITFRNKSWSINSVEDNGFATILTAVRKV